MIPLILSILALPLTIIVGSKFRRSGPKLTVAYRPDGNVSSEDKEGLVLTKQGRTLQRISSLSIGIINSGTQRINRGQTEEPVVVRLFDPETNAAVEVLTVEGPGEKLDETSVEVNVEELHSGERRAIRVQHTGPLSPEVTVGGSVKGQLTRIRLIEQGGSSVEKFEHYADWVYAILALAFFTLYPIGIAVELTGTIDQGYFLDRTQSIDPKDVEDVAKIVSERVLTFDAPYVGSKSKIDGTLPWVALLVVSLTLRKFLARLAHRFLVWAGLAEPHPFA